MIEASVDCVITIDAHSTILEFNAAAEQTFGYAREEVVGKPLTEMIIPPSLREAHLRGMAALLKGGTGKLLGKRVEMPAMRADSSEFPVELTITRIASQKPPLFTAYLRDITERKRAEEALRKSEKLFTAFMDHLPGFAWIKDVEGRYVYINETFLQLRNAVGKTDAELWPAEIASTYRANDNQVIQTKNTLQTIEPFPKDPEQGCQIVSKFPIFDQDGAVVMVGGTSVDISELIQAEKALEVQALRYKTLMETSTDSIYVLNEEGDLQEANAAFLRQRGYTAAEVKGLNVADWDARSTRAQLQKRLRKLVGGSAVFETRHRSKDGSLFDVEVNAASVQIGGKQLFFCVTRDITERKRAEGRLRKVGAQLVDAQRVAHIGSWEWDIATDTVSWSDETYRIMGFEPQEIPVTYATFLNCLHPDDRAHIDEAVQQASRDHQPFSYDYRAILPDGRVRFQHVEATVVTDESGRAVRMIGTTQDITERKAAADALRESETRFRQLAENIREVFWMSDPENTRMLYISPAYETIWGRSREALYASPASWMEAIHPEDKERMVQTRANRAQATPHDNTYRIVRPDGSIRWIRDRGFPVCDERGAVVRFAGIAGDITEQKRAEERLQEYEKVVEGLEEMIVVVDRDYRYLLANRAFLNFRGLEREQLIGRRVPDVLRPEAFAGVVGKLSECLAGKTIQYEMRYRFPDRTERDLLVSYFPIEGPRGIDRVACVLKDITERKRTEESQERGFSLMLATLESTADGILVVNTEGKIETFNRIFARMWHLPDEVLASKEDARALECVLDQLVEPEKFLEKVSYLYQHLEEESFDRLIFKDGRVFERYSRPQLIGGKVAGRVWSFRDVTERRRAAEELEKANHQLRILSRQLFHIQEEERRHLARELHDEIGQTLTAAKINLKIIEPDVPAKVAGRLDDSVQLLDRLLRQVRELSLDLRPPLLDELGLVPTLRWLVDQQAQRAGLRVTFSANVAGLEIDPDVQTACFRVAQEGITNIIRHSGAKSVTVELRCETERLWLSVRDDGAGFDPAVLEHALTPYSTLGLVGMKERTLLVRGGLEVHSAPGQGTEIRAWFPLVSHEPHPIAETA
jgi:PAS domain S-box-containing protein